jgi:hypothetical protein
MRVLRWIPVAAAVAIMACGSLIGIHDPEIERLDGGPAVEGGAVDEAGKPIEAGPNPDAGNDAGLCPANRADCNKDRSDGCETDLTTPTNCGSCDHKCLACESGKCVPQIVATGMGLDYAGFVGVDGTNLYWASAGSKGLYSVAKIGGGTPVAKASSDPFDATSIYVGPAYAGATVYTTAEGVRIIDPSTGNPFTGIQMDGCNRALGFVADETGAAYYAHASRLPGTCEMATIDITKRVPTGGVTFMQPWTFETGGYRAGESEWMALDGGYLYFVGYRDTNPGIYRIARAGGSASIVADGNFNSAPLAVDGVSVYSITNNDEALAGAAALVAYDKVTGTPTILASGERSFAPSATAGAARRAQMAVDATHVYWTAVDDSALPTKLGRIMRIPKVGGAKEILADKQPGAFGVAIDAGFVYWTTTAAIKRIPK